MRMHYSSVASASTRAGGLIIQRLCYLAGQQEHTPCSVLLLNPTLSPPLVGENTFFGDQEEKANCMGRAKAAAS